MGIIIYIYRKIETNTLIYQFGQLGYTKVLDMLPYFPIDFYPFEFYNIINFKNIETPYCMCEVCKSVVCSRLI